MNPVVSNPLSATIVQPPTNVGLQSFPNHDVSIDLNNDDGFTVVPHKKERRRGINNFVPKSIRPDNSNNQNDVASEPVLTITHNLTKEGEVRNKPLATDQVQKLPTIFFQEIGEEYAIEIISVTPVPSGSQIGPSMELDSFVEVVDDLINGSSAAKRRGRPPGSKNKPPVSKQGDTSNRFLALTDHENMADSSFNTVFQ